MGNCCFCFSHVSVAAFNVSFACCIDVVCLTSSCMRLVLAMFEVG